jgi:hypothetical protein
MSIKIGDKVRHAVTHEEGAVVAISNDTPTRVEGRRKKLPPGKSKPTPPFVGPAFCYWLRSLSSYLLMAEQAEFFDHSGERPER